MTTAQHIFSSLFWLSAVTIGYTYAAYPILIWILARACGRQRPQVMELEDSAMPSISLLIAAHNEASVIDQRINNALLIDYPTSKFEIVVASDGSTDKTAEITRKYKEHGVRLIDNVIRRGKAAVLNSAVRVLKGEIIIFSDANTYMDPMAARSLVRWFADPQISAVCGRLIVNDPISGKNVDGMYWRYETFLKRHESRLGALLGSNGAIYAMRKERFCPIPDQTIVDDFVIPLLSKLRLGGHVMYDDDATAQEDSAPDIAVEFRRRARIGEGGWQAIGILGGLLNPAQGWIAFTFLSHKVLRWMCPLFMVLLLPANVFLLDLRWYRVALLLQLMFYAAASLGAFVSKEVPFAKLLKLANMFAMMNAALLVGFFRWTSGCNGELGSGLNVRRRLSTLGDDVFM